MKRFRRAVVLCSSALLYSLVFYSFCAAEGIPDSFVYIEEVIPGIRIELRYCSEKNFMGRRVQGYIQPRAIITRKAAEALSKVQEDLNRFGLGLKIFDAYRPQSAVDDFVKWGKDLTDTKMQTEYYPGVWKKDLFKDGYIAERSGHSRGSTMDLTIVPLDDRSENSELDMGTPFDYFGPESWPESPAASPVQRANRMLLQITMQRHGFIPYPKEWWHFTLKDEPFPDTYFDFPVR